MPRLYCLEHGREHAERASDQEDSYRRFGDAVLIVEGTLISGPWRCDQCSVRLKRGKRAVLITAFPSWLANALDGYDFAEERRYFVMERAGVTVYGAATGIVQEEA